MPDAVDHDWLRELLAQPDRWTEDDASSVRLMIANQRDTLAAMHPQDARGRRSAQELVERLESALEAHLALRRHAP